MHVARRLLCLFLLGLLGAPPASAQGSFRAEVIGIIDGDTYRVLRETGQIVEVRLGGVDAPEPDQPYGEAATTQARRLIYQKRVRVSVLDPDRYGRLLARVQTEDGDLSAMLVRKGLAWHYDRHPVNTTGLERLEQRARNANRCLWSQATPIPPWRWRERASKRPRTTETKTSLPPPLRPERTSPDGPMCPADAPQKTCAKDSLDEPSQQKPRTSPARKRGGSA